MSNDIYVKENVPLFEAIYGKGLISLGGFKAIDNMFLNLDIKDKTILDVGSGIDGMTYHLVKQYNCQAIGLEIHQWMTEYANTHAPSNIPAAFHANPEDMLFFTNEMKVAEPEKFKIVWEGLSDNYKQLINHCAKGSLTYA